MHIIKKEEIDRMNETFRVELSNRSMNYQRYPYF